MAAPDAKKKSSTLRAWRARGRLLVECGECSSRGHPAAPEIARVEEDVAAIAQRAVTQARADALREQTDGAVRVVMNAFQVRQITREDAARRVRAISTDHARRIAEIIGDAQPGDGVVHQLARCPWCDAPGPAAIEQLPDDAREPPGWSSTAGGA